MITRTVVVILSLLSLSPYTLVLSDVEALAVDDPINVLAQTRVSVAYQQFTKKLENCRGKSLKLTPQRQKDFDLNQTQWSMVLKHLYIKAEQRCMGDTETHLGAMTHRYYALQKKRAEINGIKGSFDPIIMHDGEKISMDFVEIVLYALYDGELKAQLEFEKLPGKVQQRLMAAPEFQKPFDLIEASRLLLRTSD